MRLKKIEIIEHKFKDREEFLAWREQVLLDYEKSKIEYQKEIRRLFGFDDTKERRD